MTKYWKEYSKEYQPSPLSFWVHAPLDHEQWSYATEYDPPLPEPEVGRGFVAYKVEVRGFELRFSSVAEIEHCIEVLSQPNLPTTYQLAKDSWCNGWQHMHWLARLPGALKSQKNRMQIVKLLHKVKSD